MLLLIHPAARQYVGDLNSELQKEGHKPMSRIQSGLIAFLLTAMVFTHCLNFALFSRFTLGAITERSLSWLFHCAQVPWQQLLWLNARLIMRKYGVSKGRLVLDDTERKRAKNTKTLFGTHKIKDKKSNGYVMGQEFVFLVLVTDIVTIVVDVQVYRPDPKRSAWKKEDAALKAKGIAKRNRPPEPPRRKEFPTKEELAVRLLCRFRLYHGTIAVQSILFDGAYLSGYILKHAKRLFGAVQIISKLRCNQRVREGNRPFVSVTSYFANRKARVWEFALRGGEKTTVILRSARLFVASLGRVMHVVAMKYTDEEEYRYLAAADLTWRADDIVREFGFRWPIEVCFEDMKVYEGIGKAASQRGADGVGCALTLSLLADGFLLTHPDQLALANARQPLRTVGSQCRKIQYEVFLEILDNIIEKDCPKMAVEQLRKALDIYVDTRPSRKHMSGRPIPRAGPSPSLIPRFAGL